MKLPLTLGIITATAFSAFAGETPVSKEVITPVAPEPVYGLGFYGAIQAGANVYQDYGDSGDRSIDGFRFSFDADSNVGFFGGVKLGYVFGAGKVRPAIELDAYYNGFEADVDVRARGLGSGHVDGDVHSGAALANFLLRFDFGRFQPYIGAGAGVHYTELDNVNVTIGGDRFSTDAGGDTTDFAWQLIGGADYYFTEKVSAFLEYKFLNYEGIDSGFADDAIRQHLVGAGIRLHF